MDSATEISRPATVEDLCNLADGCAGTGGYLLIEGPPGHGKSWVCQQVLEVLHAKGWLVAEHYCYLGDSDGDRSERVLAETILGQPARAARDPRTAASSATTDRIGGGRRRDARRGTRALGRTRAGHTAGSRSSSTVSTT